MLPMDAGICLEFTIATPKETFVVIHRPGNVNVLGYMLSTAFLEEMTKEFDALSCKCTHMYVKGKNINSKIEVEFYLGCSQEVDLGMHLLKL